MPTEQCVFLILYILWYNIVRVYNYFLKLGESIYVAVDLIPILLGSLPLAHNAEHSLVDRYIDVRPYRTLLRMRGATRKRSRPDWE